MYLNIKSLDNIGETAKEFLKVTESKKVFAFYGPMGAGKTTFIKAICETLGIEDVINSPTFAIINEYSLPDGNSAYHFDFYRINKLQEVINLGFDDYINSGCYCFMEWPEKIEDLLTDDVTKVRIEVLDDETRRIEIPD
jgi:tRNA threonylcarbamoyladenosine biosynthesis protein TsaE